MDLTQVNSEKLALRDAAHARDLSDALASVKPVIVRIPADSGGLPKAAAPAGNAPTPGQQDVPVPTERNIGPAITLFAGECQQDRDSLDQFMAFYNDLRNKVNVK